MERNSDKQGRDTRILLREATAAVRDCAESMETQAVSLLKALPTVPMDEELRASALELIGGLRDASSRVTFELALLLAELGEGKAEAASTVQRLAGMDALMMGAVAAMADVADELENAAEIDEAHEQSFVLVIEATAAMLQGLEQAKAATQALDAARRPA